MTPRDVALLAFRLLGLWLAASGLEGLASAPSLWSGVPEDLRPMTLVSAILPSLVALGIGVPVAMSADWFAARTFPVDADPQWRVQIRGEALAGTAFAIIGVYFIAEGLPALVNSAAVYVLSDTSTRTILGRDEEQQRLIWTAAAKAATAGEMARLVIGALFVAGPARLAAAIASTRKDLRGTLVEGDEPAAGAGTGGVSPNEPPR